MLGPFPQRNYNIWKFSQNFSYLFFWWCLTVVITQWLFIHCVHDFMVCPDPGCSEVRNCPRLTKHNAYFLYHMYIKWWCSCLSSYNKLSVIDDDDMCFQVLESGKPCYQSISENYQKLSSQMLSIPSLSRHTVSRVVYIASQEQLPEALIWSACICKHKHRHNFPYIVYSVTKSTNCHLKF